jgi:hypothetical protein
MISAEPHTDLPLVEVAHADVNGPPSAVVPLAFTLCHFLLLPRLAPTARTVAHTPHRAHTHTHVRQGALVRWRGSCVVSDTLRMMGAEPHTDVPLVEVAYADVNGPPSCGPSCVLLWSLLRSPHVSFLLLPRLAPTARTAVVQQFALSPSPGGRNDPPHESPIQNLLRVGPRTWRPRSPAQSSPRVRGDDGRGTPFCGQSVRDAHA